MKIIIDDKIPYIRGAFEGVAETIYVPGANITPDIVKNADALITRTRTQCNERLLKDSSVKFIATATIGYDHIDTSYCNSVGIGWTNAPGCNSTSVEQYLASALMVLAENQHLTLEKLCIGIVGVGNVGSKVARLCRLLGMKVLLNDPPRERLEGHEAFVSLTQLKEQADIITLHVPLNMEGEDATYQLVDADFLRSLRKKTILINACRGEVIESKALKHALKHSEIAAFVCDCWENEPSIEPELLSLTTLATPHIAGYSADGKANGTKMSVRAVSIFFGLGLDDWQPTGLNPPKYPTIEMDGKGLNKQDIIAKAILHTYDIRSDESDLRNNVELFELLRNDYRVRREFQAFTVKCVNMTSESMHTLQSLGFNVSD